MNNLLKFEYEFLYDVKTKCYLCKDKSITSRLYLPRLIGEKSHITICHFPDVVGMY